MINSQEDENEIVRYTLYGYIGSKIQNINVKERQKKSYAKLSFLTDTQFLNLVRDIKSEINRRVLGLQTSETENKKLVALSEPKFRDLVIDVFFMFNKRVPSTRFENTDAPDSLLFNFENLINSLKNDDETVLKNIKSEESVFNKLEQYQTYIKNEMVKNGKDTQIVDYISTILQMRDRILVEILTDPTCVRSVSEKMLSQNFYYQKIRDKVIKLDQEPDILERNKITLQVLEILLYKNSFNSEIEETIDLLANYENPEVLFEQRVKKLAKSIKKHAERIDDTEKVQTLKKFSSNTQRKSKEERILFLADILRDLLAKERRCDLQNLTFS